VETGTAEVTAFAPAIFTADASGKGVAAAVAVQADRSGVVREVPVFRCAGPGSCAAQALEPQENRPIYLSLFGTGMRHGTDLTVTFGGEPVVVLWSGAQPQFPGLDQINLRIDHTLRVRGERDLMIVAAGRESNTVRLDVR
jgi:uncharacterized protein (TIGR03437 family)